jgi:hypothetical protein
MSSREPDPPQPTDADSPFTTVARTVREDPLLWPVATVSWLVCCTFGGFVLFYALRVRSLVAGVAMLFVLFFTVWGFDRDLRQRRLSPQNGLVLSLWAGSAAAATAFELLGV